MKTYLNILTPIFKKDYVQTVLVFVFVFGILSLVYFPLNKFVSHDDSFFHIRFAELFREQGFDAFRNFPWIHLSKMAQGNEYFIYYNFLFYIVLAPFTYIQPLFLGLKFFATSIASATFTGFFFSLKKLGQRWPFLWTLAVFMAISPGFIQRILLARPFVIAPVLLLLILLALHYKKHWVAGALTIVYFFWHSATFFFPLGITVVYALFHLFYHHPIKWQPLFFVGGTTAISLLVTQLLVPGFFQFTQDIILRSLWEMLHRDGVKLAEGQELYPADFFDFLRSNVFLIIAFIIACVNEIYHYITRKFNDAATQITSLNILQTTLFFLSLGLFFATFLSFRNSDFFVWFSMLFIALSFNQLIHEFRLSTHGHIILKFSAVIIGILILVSQLLTAHSAIARHESYDSIKNAAEWFTNNTPRGSVVFLSNWSDFARVFYYNQHNYYTMGIEPLFLYDFDPELYWLWLHIARNGYACSQEKCNDLEQERALARKNLGIREKWNKEQGDKVAQIVKTKFSADYILVNQRFGKFYDLLNNNDNFERMFGDPNQDIFFIYKIK